MVPQNQYEIKSLTLQDRKMLRRQFLFLIAFGVFVGAIFFFIFKFVLPTGEMGYIPVFVFTAFALIFGGFISYFFWGTYIDLKNGVKQCYTGIVTDKRVNKHTSSSARHNRSGGSHAYGSSRKSTQTYYYISIENIEHSVSYKQYSQAKLGDKVSIEISPKKKEVLDFKVLEKNNDTTTLSHYTISKKRYERDEKSFPMTIREIELVKKMFFKTIRKDLMYLIPIIILLFVLWKGIFIFLIPLIIAFIYYSFKLLIKYNRYAKFNRNGYLKTVTKVQVIDKLKATSNRSSTKFQIETNQGNINVSEHIYNQVQASQVINLHKASFIDLLFEVSFDYDN